MFNKLYTKIINAPSIVWVFLLPAMLIAFIGSIIFIFFALATIEGVASVIMLLIGFSVIYSSSSLQIPAQEKAQFQKGASIAIAGGIVFFALMGVAVDQTGNYFYNKPIEIIFCKDDSGLKRGVDILHPLPGRTDIVQDYSCRDENGNFVNQISLFAVIGVRFIEYVFIGYFLIYLSKAVKAYRFKVKNLNSHESPPVVKV